MMALTGTTRKLVVAVLVAYVVVDISGYVMGGKDGLPAVVDAVMNIWPPAPKNLIVLAVAAVLAYLAYQGC